MRLVLPNRRGHKQGCWIVTSWDASSCHVDRRTHMIRTPNGCNRGTSSFVMSPNPITSTVLPQRLRPVGSPNLRDCTAAWHALQFRRSMNVSIMACSAHERALPVPRLGMLLTAIPRSLACCNGIVCHQCFCFQN